jgi:transcription-repair coupling factor (superfamily II helicase)
MRGEEISRETDPEITVRVPAYIPDDYIDDIGRRLEIYKQLNDAAASASPEQQIDDVLEMVRDRFGPYPQEVTLLGELMNLKALASQLAARVVEVGDGRAVLTLNDDTPIDRAKLMQRTQQQPKRFRLLPDSRLVVHWETGAPQLQSAHHALRELLTLINLGKQTVERR